MDVPRRKQFFFTLTQHTSTHNRRLWAIQSQFHALAYLVINLFIESKFAENTVMYSVQMHEEFGTS